MRDRGVEIMICIGSQIRCGDRLLEPIEGIPQMRQVLFRSISRREKGSVALKRNPEIVALLDLR